MDDRLRTIERTIGRPVSDGGLFRARYERTNDGGGGASIVAQVVEAIWWLIRRARTTAPAYVVLAFADDTLLAFAAGVAAGTIGEQTFREKLDDVVATRLGTWDIDITVSGTTHRLTCVSCDGASLSLIERLAAQNTGAAE